MILPGRRLFFITTTTVLLMLVEVKVSSAASVSNKRDGNRGPTGSVHTTKKGAAPSTVWTDLQIIQQAQKEYYAAAKKNGPNNDNYDRRLRYPENNNEEENKENEAEEEKKQDPFNDKEKEEAEATLGMVCGFIIQMFDRIAPQNENRKCDCNIWTQSIECNYQNVSCRDKLLPTLDIEFKMDLFGGGAYSRVRICQEFMEDEFDRVCLQTTLNSSGNYDSCEKATMGTNNDLFGGFFGSGGKKECSCEVCPDGLTLDVDCTAKHPLAATNGCQQVFFQDTCLDFAPTTTEDEVVVVEPTEEIIAVNREYNNNEEEAAEGRAASSPNNGPPPPGPDLPRARFFFEYGTEVEGLTPQQLASKWSTKDPQQNKYTTSKRIQRYAMAALYFATTTHEQEWFHSNNWLDYQVDECNWYSSIDQPCSPSGELEYLDLTNNSLSGPLGPEIGYLRSVEYLYLSYNYLTGAMPTTTGMLTNLIDLDIYACNIEGNIPTEIGQLTYLESLSLADNWFNGTIPSELGLLTNIFSIELDGNNITGPVPTEVCNLISDYDVQVYVDCFQDEGVQCDCGCICAEPEIMK